MLRAYSSKIKFALWALVLGAILLPYQNCSVYKSDGKEQIESMLENENMKYEHCLPYLDNNVAANIFDTSGDAIYTQKEDVGLDSKCLIGKKGGYQDSVNTVVCEISPVYADLAAMDESLQSDMSNEAIASLLDIDVEDYIDVYFDQADYLAPLTQGHYGYSFHGDLGVILIYVGAEQTRSHGVACRIVFDGGLEEFNRDRSTALDRVTKLVAEIAQNL